MKLSLPVTDNLDLYAKGGAAYNYLSVSGNDNVHLGMFESDSSLDGIWEIGAEYALAPNWSLRFGTSVIDGIGNAKTGKSDLYFTSLGLTYKFKAKPEPKPETIVKLVPEATYYPEQVTLHFEFGESRFVVESKQWHSWNELALSVKQGQGKVSITGYTDAKGTDSANDIESLRRATYAADMLIKAGVDEERILINSKGSADPLVNEDLMRNESALNRRVVIQFNRRLGLNMNKSIVVLTTLVSLVSCKNGDTDLMPSRPTDPTSNHAPQVLDEQIIGNIADKQLELTGTYYDEEGDEPDVEQFTFRWLKDGVDIPGADDYILPVSDASSLLGVTVSGCVTPSAKTGELIGDEYCTDLSIGLSSDISAEVSIDSSVFPLPGNTISASYTYDDNGAGIPEGKSIFGFVTHTLGDDHMPEFTQCDSGAGKDCMYDINRRYIDKTIRACVLPIGEGTQVGPLNCDSTKGIGTKITGSLEYGATLTANIYGLTGDTKWKANLSAQDGWTNDKAEDRVEIAEGEGGVGTNLSYTIGTRDKAVELVPGLMDMGSSRDQQVSLDNQLDDWDWLVAEANGDPLPKDATYFIGKDISFCIDSTELGYEYCVNASEATPLSAKGDAEICTDDTECVTGGAYYPETPDKPLFYSRGIEPIREILIPGSAEGRYLDSLSGTRDDAYYHRPLTITEAKKMHKN